MILDDMMQTQQLGESGRDSGDPVLISDIVQFPLEPMIS